MEVLASGAIFRITAEGGVARCVVENRDDITAEEGARCAEEMRSVLMGQVLARRSAYSGVVFDVRRGPPVFGPKTRASLEEMFRLGAESGKRIAVRVGDAAIQKLQFGSLCRDWAPEVARVFEDADGDRDTAWAAGG